MRLKPPSKGSPQLLAAIFRDGVIAGRTGLDPRDSGYPPGGETQAAFLAGMQVGKAGW